MSSPDYSVIILCHNHVETTKRCLDALFRTDLSEARIIVVDNGSTDGTAEYLLQFQPCELDIIVFTEENLGVGEGYTRGFQMVDSEFFVTLNNDMLIHDADWLEKMRAPFANCLVAQVGLEGSNCWLDWHGMGHKLEEFAPPVRRLARPDYVETSCMMARTEAVHKCGPLFDPAYHFAYCEDSDLSLRLRRHGYQIAHIPLNVEHIGGVTLQDENTVGAKKFYVQNHDLLQSRWGKYLRTKAFD